MSNQLTSAIPHPAYSHLTQVNTKKSFKFHVSVPEGAKEGFVLFVKTPNGVKSSVRVPKGAKPGSILICTVAMKETDFDELD